MRARKIKRRLKNYLFERITLSFVPHSRGRMRSFRLPRFIILLLFLCLIGYMSIVTYLYKGSLDQNQTANAKIDELTIVQTENISLKAGLAQVAKETDAMRKVLLELEKKGENIEALISDEQTVASNEKVKDLILFNYRLLDGESVNPLGGGGEYLNTNAFDLLSQIREELRMLRVELPLQDEILVDLEGEVEDYNALKAATPTGWPLDDDGKGYISSEYGFRKDPVTSQNTFHEGLDIGIWYGTPVIATADGKVTYADWMGSYGRVVFIDHGYGYQTRYAHNSKLAVQSGQYVKRGDVIAYSGNSGKSTGPHLHYEVRVNGVPKNPRSYIKN